MDTIISNNGEVAVFSNGERYPRGTLLPQIGYRNILSVEAFRVVFAPGSTLEEIKERLKSPQSTSDGTAIGTVLPSLLRPSVNSLGYNWGERQRLRCFGSCSGN